MENRCTVKNEIKSYTYESGMSYFFNSRRNEIKVTEITHFLGIKDKMTCIYLCKNFSNCIKREIDFKKIDETLTDLTKKDLDELNINKIYDNLSNYYQLHSKDAKTIQLHCENMLIFCGGMINKYYLEPGRKTQGNSLKYFRKYDDDKKENWDFYINKLDKFGLKIVCHSLSFNINLKSLLIHGCKLDDQDLNLIFSFLSQNNNSTLKNLDVMYNEISDQGCKYLINFLMENTSLESLAIGNNKKITISGVYSISNGLLMNTTLKHLNLQGMQMNCDYDEVINTILLNNQGLKSLEIHNNNFTNESIKFWESSLIKTNLTELNLTANSLSEDCGSLLGNILNGHMSFEKIILKSNSISKASLKILYEVFERNIKLKVVDVYANLPLIDDTYEKFRKLNILRRNQVTY